MAKTLRIGLLIKWKLTCKNTQDGTKDKWELRTLILSKLQSIAIANKLVKGVLGYKSPWTGRVIDINSSYNDIYFCILHKYYKFGDVFFHPHKVISFTSIDRAIREVLIPMGRDKKMREAERIRTFYKMDPEKEFIGFVDNE